MANFFKSRYSQAEQLEGKVRPPLQQNGPLSLFNRFFSGNDSHPRPSRSKRVERTVLLVSPSRGEQNTAWVISVSERWRIRMAPTLNAALKIKETERITVVLYDQDLPGIEWQEGVSVLLHSSRPSCLILLSFFIHERLRRNVLACGGYDAANKPLDRKTLVPLVNGCCMLTNDINLSSYRYGSL